MDFLERARLRLRDLLPRYWRRKERETPANSYTIVSDVCAGIADCVAVCPVDCILTAKDIAGKDYSLIDDSRCIACGACLSVCPIKGAILDEWRPELQISRTDPYRVVGPAEFKRLEDPRGIDDGNNISSDILDDWPTKYLSFEDEHEHEHEATIELIVEVGGVEYALLRNEHRIEGGKRFQLYRLLTRGDRSILESVEGKEFEHVLSRLKERGAMPSNG